MFYFDRALFFFPSLVLILLPGFVWFDFVKQSWTQKMNCMLICQSFNCVPEHAHFFCEPPQTHVEHLWTGPVSQRDGQVNSVTWPAAEILDIVVTVVLFSKTPLLLEGGPLLCFSCSITIDGLPLWGCSFAYLTFFFIQSFFSFCFVICMFLILLTFCLPYPQWSGGEKTALPSHRHTHI